MYFFLEYPNSDVLVTTWQAEAKAALAANDTFLTKSITQGKK